MRITPLALFFLLITSLASPAFATRSQAPDPDRIVVLISLDGLAAYYLDDPKAEMPNLRALAKSGARAESMKASTPTVTWTNHVTLATGDTPAHHGVVGNSYYDRAEDKRVTLLSDPVFDQDQIVKVPTIYDAAKAAGMKTAAIRWPASRNAKHLDWTFPDVAHDDILIKYTTPSLLAECKEAGLWADGEAINGPKSTVRIVSDEMSAKVFELILKRHRPNLALLHLIDIDHLEHKHGPKSPEAYAAVKTADAQVGEIWELLKREFPNKATLIIVSDHGFSPTEHQVLGNVILRDAGLVVVKGDKLVSGPVRMVSQGGAALIYILDDANRSAIAEQIKKAFTGATGVSKIVMPDELKDYGVADPKDDPHAPDMILFSQQGYVFGDTAGGTTPTLDKNENKGSHGHDPSFPDLHATFIAWGVGIKPGSHLGEIQNTDVTPTIAALLGLSMPNTDGKPLTAILTDTPSQR